MHIVIISFSLSLSLSLSPLSVSLLSLSLSLSLSLAGAELHLAHEPSGEVVWSWDKCRLMGDILVLDDMVSDGSD
jgi:hypothetical protein